MDFWDYEAEGQLTIMDLFKAPEERLIAVSRIVARAQKSMSLSEWKTFVLALTKIEFTKTAAESEHMIQAINENGIIENQFWVGIDKKELAGALGLNADSNHLSQNLYREIKELPKHSYIEIDRADVKKYGSGTLITNVVFNENDRNEALIKFNSVYLPLLTGLTEDRNYITMWSADLLNMKSYRSIVFYEFLRNHTDTRKTRNEIGLGISHIKKMFGIPMDGKGSYMREKGGFNRNEFEKKVILPLCEDLKNCKMINLELIEGEYFEKVKVSGRVKGYKFYWSFTSHPRVASASEVKKIQERVDADPQVMKVAKDIIAGKDNPKPVTKRKANSQTDFMQHENGNDDLDLIEALVAAKNSDDPVSIMNLHGFVKNEKGDWVKKKKS